MRELAAAVKSKGIAMAIANQLYLYSKDITNDERQVIWFPQTHHFDGKRPSIRSMIAGMESFNRSSEQVAGESAAGVVDLDARLAKNLEYFYDDMHYTPKGNEAVAHAFLDYITEHKMIE